MILLVDGKLGSRCTAVTIASLTLSPSILKVLQACCGVDQAASSPAAERPVVDRRDKLCVVNAIRVCEEIDGASPRKDEAGATASEQLLYGEVV